MAVKVFGVGLSKTGTTSLAAALRLLGLRCYEYPPPASVFSLADCCDALTDTSVIPFYKVLATRYPEAKFILTLRSMEDWLVSCAVWWQKHPTNKVTHKTRLAVYGSAQFDSQRFCEVYGAHVADVTHFFAGQPGRLLKLRICSGEGWEKLCPFLGLPSPRKPFPAIRPEGTRCGDTIT